MRLIISYRVINGFTNTRPIEYGSVEELIQDFESRLHASWHPGEYPEIGGDFTLGGHVFHPSSFLTGWDREVPCWELPNVYTVEEWFEQYLPKNNFS